MGTNSTIDKRVSARTLTNAVQQIKNGKKFPKIYLLHGAMEEEQLKSLYLDKSLVSLISTTRGEGFGLPMLEAAVCGLPVVATDTGAIREIVRGDYGKIVSDDPVNENYIKSFSEAIIKQENKWNQNLAIKCIVNFHEKWSEKEFSKQLLKIFSIVR